VHSHLDANARRFIHLVDGAVSDNLGLRNMLDRVTLADPAGWMSLYGLQNVRRLVQIVVNAQVGASVTEIDQNPDVPDSRSIAFGISNMVG
jgi:NTE family protein